MEKEFNLSEKICEAVMLNKDKTSTNLILDVIPDEDVKEFIKRLKEETKASAGFKDKQFIRIDILDSIIDKLAGDNLNGKRI